MHANVQQPEAPGDVQPILRVRDLQAHYRTTRLGLKRGVRAVDGVSFTVRRGEIFGLAGESSSGKTTLIKSIAGVIRPPLEIVGGTVDFAFLPGFGGLHRAPPAELARIRWRHLSYIVQGSMSVLNPVRRVESAFLDFAYPHIGGHRKQFEQQVIAHLARVRLEPSVLTAFPHELSGACVNAPRLRSLRFAVLISSSPTNPRPHWMCWCRKKCSA